jgi:transposase
MDWSQYRERNRIERLVNRLKQYRRIATRYDKTAASYGAFVTLAALRMWL